MTLIEIEAIEALEREKNISIAFKALPHDRFDVGCRFRELPHLAQCEERPHSLGTSDSPAVHSSAVLLLQLCLSGPSSNLVKDGFHSIGKPAFQGSTEFGGAGSRRVESRLPFLATL